LEVAIDAVAAVEAVDVANAMEAGAAMKAVAVIEAMEAAMEAVASLLINNREDPSRFNLGLDGP
jgi:hypothetical protein